MKLYHATTQKYAWECNECGTQEYTMYITKDDVHQLGCGKCGGDEWHEVPISNNILEQLYVISIIDQAITSNGEKVGLFSTK